MKSSRDAGFTLIEVMMAMIVLAFGILGVMATFQWSDHAVRVGSTGALALSLAETRLEAKRAVPWVALLEDDLNGDGIADLVMRDDGVNGDESAGDGIYSATMEQHGVRVTWTVQADRPGPVRLAGAVTIVARAQYTTGAAPRDIALRTIRANPSYIGM